MTGGQLRPERQDWLSCDPHGFPAKYFLQSDDNGAAECSHLDKLVLLVLPHECLQLLMRKYPSRCANSRSYYQTAVINAAGRYLTLRKGQICIICKAKRAIRDAKYGSTIEQEQSFKRIQQEISKIAVSEVGATYCGIAGEVWREIPNERRTRRSRMQHYTILC